MGFIGFEDPLAWAEELELSQEQVQELRELRREHRVREADLRAKLEKLRAQWDYELGKREPDFKKLRKLAKDLADAEVRLEAERMEYELKVLEVLTPEQREKFLRMRKPFGWLKGFGERLGRKLEEFEREFPGFRLKVRVYEDEEEEGI